MGILAVIRLGLSVALGLVLYLVYNNSRKILKWRPTPFIDVVIEYMLDLGMCHLSKVH